MARSGLVPVRVLFSRGLLVPIFVPIRTEQKRERDKGRERERERERESLSVLHTPLPLLHNLLGLLQASSRAVVSL